MVYGKVPPQAKDLEEAVIGAIMLDKSAFDIAMETLKPECFYVEAHQRIYKSMISLQQKGQPIDMLTVVEELRKLEELDIVGGPYFVLKLTNNVVSGAHIEAHSRIILQKFIQRELIRISGEIMNDAYEDSTDAFDLLDSAESMIGQVAENAIQSDYKDLNEGVPEFVTRIEFLKEQESPVTGVPTGFRELDRVTCGWQPTDLIIIAARPSVGKTAFALNLAVNAAMSEVRKTPVGFFSLEMSMQQLLGRVVSMDSGIHMSKISSGKVDNITELRLSAERAGSMRIYCDDTASLSMMQLRGKARRMVKKHKVGLIIIDYLQLMTGDAGRGGNREQEISGISRGLKKLAKEIKVPVIALSQLSRDVEKRANKEPVLSDLRESGAIEQDADLVGFLYRPSEEDMNKDADLRDTGSLKIAKNRHGELKILGFNVNNGLQRWSETGVLDVRPWQSRPEGLPPGNFIPTGTTYHNQLPPEKEDLPF